MVLVTEARQGVSSFAVRVRDLSISGAKLEAKIPPPIGTDVHLLHETLEIRCRVTWIDGDYFGVEFHFPLDPSEIPAGILAGAQFPNTPA